MPKQETHLDILHIINRTVHMVHTATGHTSCYVGKIVQEKREGMKFSNDDKDVTYMEKVLRCHTYS